MIIYTTKFITAYASVPIYSMQRKYFCYIGFILWVSISRQYRPTNSRHHLVTLFFGQEWLRLLFCCLQNLDIRCSGKIGIKFTEDNHLTVRQRFAKGLAACRKPCRIPGSGIDFPLLNGEYAEIRITFEV